MPASTVLVHMQPQQATFRAPAWSLSRASPRRPREASTHPPAQLRRETSHSDARRRLLPTSSASEPLPKGRPVDNRPSRHGSGRASGGSCSRRNRPDRPERASALALGPSKIASPQDRYETRLEATRRDAAGRNSAIWQCTGVGGGRASQIHHSRQVQSSTPAPVEQREQLWSILWRFGGVWLNDRNDACCAQARAACQPPGERDWEPRVCANPHVSLAISIRSPCETA